MAYAVSIGTTHCYTGKVQAAHHITALIVTVTVFPRPGLFTLLVEHKYPGSPL